MQIFLSAPLILQAALLLICGVIRAEANVALMGLARDFLFDITARNKDRLVFSSQGSGVQAFTFYSEGDLTDNLAFYLYGLWTFDGQSVPPLDLRLTLLKTRNGLPLERYNVTDLLVSPPGRFNPGPSQESLNIMTSLGRYCASLRDFIRELQLSQLAPSDIEPDTSCSSLTIGRLEPSPDVVHSKFSNYLPRFPEFLESLLQKSILPFKPNFDQLPMTSRLHGQLQKPDDFYYTWQKTVDGFLETLSLVYDRGVFRLVQTISTETILDVLLTSA